MKSLEVLLRADSIKCIKLIIRVLGREKMLRSAERIHYMLSRGVVQAYEIKVVAFYSISDNTLKSNGSLGRKLQHHE